MNTLDKDITGDVFYAVYGNMDVDFAKSKSRLWVILFVTLNLDLFLRSQHTNQPSIARQRWSNTFDHSGVDKKRY